MICIRLRRILDCSDQQIEDIRLLRNKPEVREFMINTHYISKEEHINWLDQLRISKNQIVYLVLNKMDVYGLISFNGIDYLKKECDFGIYLDTNRRGGLGSALLYAQISYVFDKLQLEIINCEVLKTNELAIKLYKRYGFRECALESPMYLNKQRQRIKRMFLTANHWHTNKTDLYNIEKHKMDKYNIDFE